MTASECSWEWDIGDGGYSEDWNWGKSSLMSVASCF